MAPLTLRQAERIAMDIRNYCGCRILIKPDGFSPLTWGKLNTSTMIENKHMKTLVLNIISLAVAITATYARIGETYDQAVARYGAPLGASIDIIFPDEKWTSFRKGGFHVNAIFHNGKIDTIEYIKIIGYNKYSESFETAALSEIEINNLLKANYNEIWQNSYSKSWTAPNLTAIHEYNMASRQVSRYYYRLVIWTDEAGQRRAEQMAAKETEAQVGF